MFARSETFGLSGYQKESGIFAIRLLILLIICVFGLPAEAETNIYVFVPGQSTVVQTGGFAGVHETYGIEGKFRLTVDFDAGIASFDEVDANLTEPTGFLYSQSLGEIFNMTGLAGTIIDDTTIDFDGATADGTESDISLTLTFIDDSAGLSGKTTPPPNSADMFLYELDAAATKKYAGGTGEPDNPYQIATAEDLMLLGGNPEDYDKHFILTDNIDLEPNLPGCKVFDRAVIAPDKNEPDLWYSFNGVLDGNGFTISNLNCKSEKADYTGLFGLVGKGTINDLRLVNAKIDAGAGNYVGSLVGMNIYGTISGCSVQGGSVTGGKYVSGLVGYNTGFITDSCSNTIVLGKIVVGGLVGQNGAWVVGVGEMLALEGHIDNCYSTCNVTGSVMVGGLVGFNEFGFINQCYSNGIVSGNEQVGGLIGENNARVNVCFWDVETSGLTSSAAGIGKTTAEMQTAGTFISWGACGPFWTIDEGRSYPHLAWEDVPGEFINAPSYGGGKGTAHDPYLIYIAEELNMLGLSFCDWDKHFKLMANIDLSDFQYGEALIAQGGWYEGTPFAGVFDGNGHTISHLTIIGEANLGLFGYLGSGAEVRDLGVLDVNIVGADMVGALAGYSEGNLIRCYSSGAVNGALSVGSVVGSNWESINQCYSSCIVTGGDWTGGLVGSNHGVITQCYSTGEISGRDRVGGLVGYSSETVSKCYSTSAVSGDSDVGGLVGYNYKGSIATSYSTGTVIGDESVGGLVGDHSYGGATASFWDVETSGKFKSAGGMGLTTADMQNINTYLNAGWDFVDEIANGTCDYWQISPGDYPRLRYLAGDSPVMPEGLGTAQEPYLIRDARDLGTMWFEPIAHYRLETSLDLSGIIWSMAVVPWFGGTFDGNGYVISNLQIQGSSYLGLFGELGPEAKLSNLGLEAVNVNGDWYVGGLAGYNCADITNCYSTGTVTGHNFYVGGLVGSNGHGSIAASYSTGMVSGYAWVGGLVGENYQGSIATSYITGTVTGHSHVGGLVGGNRGSIATSYSTGTVSGDVWVGGLVGDNMWYFGWPKELRGIIRNSYSTSAVNGETYVGGLVGWNNRGNIATSYSTGWVSGVYSVGGLVGNAGYDNDYGDIATSFWDMDTSGQATSVGGTGKTTVEMQTAGTFLETGWDFVDEAENGTEDIWWILEGQDYPRFVWELIQDE